jgi:general stress protein 26
MKSDEIISATQLMVRTRSPFVLGTVDRDGMPQLRWMGGCMLEEPLTAFMAAGAGSRKMGQMRAHPQCQLMFQHADYSRVATLSGVCDVVEDIETKRRVWHGIPGCAEYFSGPEDPNFGVIRFVCRRIELTGADIDPSPAVAEL